MVDLLHAKTGAWNGGLNLSAEASIWCFTAMVNETFFFEIGVARGTQRAVNESSCHERLVQPVPRPELPEYELPLECASTLWFACAAISSTVNKNKLSAQQNEEQSPPNPTCREIKGSCTVVCWLTFQNPALTCTLKTCSQAHYPITSVQRATDRCRWR